MENGKKKKVHFLFQIQVKQHGWVLESDACFKILQNFHRLAKVSLKFVYTCAFCVKSQKFDIFPQYCFSVKLLLKYLLLSLYISYPTSHMSVSIHYIQLLFLKLVERSQFIPLENRQRFFPFALQQKTLRFSQHYTGKDPRIFFISDKTHCFFGDPDRRAAL